MSDRKRTYIFDVSTQWDSFVAVVSVDLNEVQKLQRAHAKLKEEGITLVDLSVWGNVDLYETNDAVQEWIGEQGLQTDLEEQFFARVDADPEFEKITEPVRLSFSKMVVGDEGVYWELAPKHHDGVIETYSLRAIFASHLRATKENG